MQATIGQGGTRVQATTGQGGTVRRVSVMSSDDEKRMAMRQEMLAARRAQQMPPQKIKLVYNRNQKPDTVNKGSEKIVKLSAWDAVNEELRRRQQMNMKVPKGPEVVEDIVKEAVAGGDVSKQVENSEERDGNNSQARVDVEELIEVVGKVVGVGEGQEFEFDDQAIVVEDELLGNGGQGEVDQGSDVGSVVGQDAVKEATGEGEKSSVGKAVVEKQGEPTESSPEIAERSLSPIIMSSRKKARLSSPKSTPLKATLQRSTPPKVTYGINTPSPTLERRSSAAPPEHLLRRAISSLIRSNEEKVHLHDIHRYIHRAADSIDNTDVFVKIWAKDGRFLAKIRALDGRKDGQNSSLQQRQKSNLIKISKLSRISFLATQPLKEQC